jgi:DNA-directed RNA polymerase II subunit RPB11
VFPAEVPNTTVFTFNKEDHTLGNLISQRLLKYDYITFSAYKVPHPLFATFELRVTTDGSITPKDAVVRCCKDVIQDLSKVSMSFQGEWLNQKIIEEGQRDAEVRDQGNY